jgi:hypothetical protein
MGLSDWYDSLSSQKTLYDGAAEIIDRKPINLAGLSGIQLTESFNTKTTVVYINRNSFVLRLTLEPFQLIENEIVTQILSTFKFLDNTNFSN